MEERKKILIIEDEPAIQNLLKNALLELECSVFVANNGVEGFNTAITANPDLIILDIIMPNMDGTELLEKIRATEWGSNVPIIMLTNLNPPDRVLDRIIKYHPKYYLIKSNIDLNDLKEKVSGLL